uniref:Uncharacterized protein n=1 Tax=Cacopsylla melanoneura TaxID=428564 RepID=A0A8D9B4Q2_9HEMI
MEDKGTRYDFYMSRHLIYLHDYYERCYFFESLKPKRMVVVSGLSVPVIRDPGDFFNGGRRPPLRHTQVVFTSVTRYNKGSDHCAMTADSHIQMVNFQSCIVFPPMYQRNSTELMNYQIIPVVEQYSTI